MFHCQNCSGVVRSDDCKYVCFGCDYQTKHKHHLVRHIRRHTGNKPYKCPHCHYKATSRDYVLTHIKFKHKSFHGLKKLVTIHYMEMGEK